MSTSIEEGPSSPAATSTPTGSSDTGHKADPPCKKYPKCNGAYLGKGCDGAGKIQGGIATFPLLGWWPIKAYRPCPALTEAGYGYKRKGQDFSEFIAGERRTRTEDDE
ncbi:conserved cys-containing protein [Nannochloropsis oceanica]